MLQNGITGFLLAVDSNNVQLARWLLHPIPLKLQYFCDPYTIEDVRLSLTAGYLSFGPVGAVAQCVVHALKGLACRTPVLLAHAEVKKHNIFFMDPKLKYPAVSR